MFIFFVVDLHNAEKPRQNSNEEKVGWVSKRAGQKTFFWGGAARTIIEENGEKFNCNVDMYTFLRDFFWNFFPRISCIFFLGRLEERRFKGHFFA